VPKKYEFERMRASFRSNNLQLLAEQYNISQADADIIQAKIWDLPEISFTGNAYNPEDKKPFDVLHSKDVEIQQLFVLGGKRKKEVDFAKTNKELAKLQYKQLAVDLLSQLKETYYSLYYDGRKLLRIDNQLSFLNDLLQAYKIQTSKETFP
jgi:cobalt-zinc-cadmium efflux system outer membrane protein